MGIAPLSKNTLHVAIDMQRLFAEETPWHTPAIGDILPNVLALCEARPPQTLFARFVVPRSAEGANGQWAKFYRRWSSVTLNEIETSKLGLVQPLAEIARPGSIVDKVTYSVFGSPDFTKRLQRSSTDTLIFSGVETDVCVYASVLDAVDAGYRVIIAGDAVASGDMKAHAAVIEILVPRLSEQIEILSTNAILDLLRN